VKRAYPVASTSVAICEIRRPTGRYDPPTVMENGPRSTVSRYRSPVTTAPEPDLPRSTAKWSGVCPGVGSNRT
jgi:hypothetical protein